MKGKMSSIYIKTCVFILLLLWKPTSCDICNSTELINDALTNLRTTDVYEDLQGIMVKYVMHFEYNETMTIETNTGKKEIKRDEEILKFDDFLIYSTVAIELTRKKVMDVSFRYDYPLNAFRFVRNNTAVLQKVVNKMLSTFKHYKDKERSGDVKALKTVIEHCPFPTIHDYTASTQSLLDLQDIYSLQSSDIANGVFVGDGSEILNAEECMELAEMAKLSGNTLYHISWLETARSRVVTMGDTSVEKSTLHAQLYEGYTSVGCQCVAEARAIRKQLVDLHPDNVKRYPNVCEDNTQDTCVNKLGKTTGCLTKHPSDTESKFKKLCQTAARSQVSNIKSPSTNNGHLSCYYKRTHDPFYYINPFKVEILSHKPRIEVVHELLEQSEKDMLIHHGISNLLVEHDKKKTKTLQHMVRATTTTLKSNRQMRLVSLIQQRIAAVSNANYESFGKFFLTNYGIGGYDKVHADHHEENKHNPQISITIFLNTASMGGDAVFPNLGLSIKPVDKMALVVYNTGSDIILYGACPVVNGNKWIATTNVFATSDRVSPVL